MAAAFSAHGAALRRRRSFNRIVAKFIFPVKRPLAAFRQAAGMGAEGAKQEKAPPE